jgi:hypothetical protein
VDPGQASLAGFATHLAAYTPLFRHLAHFRFLYMAPSTVHFVRAEQCFASLVAAPLQKAVPEELERYFRLRAAWDGKQYAQLSNNDIEWLDQANQRFGDGRVEGLYAAWAAGREWRLLVVDARPSSVAEFSTCLVNAGCQAKPKELGSAR